MKHQCKYCSNSYDSEPSLHQHMKSKHPDTIQHSSSSNRTLFYIAFVVVVLVAAVFLMKPSAGKYDALAQCITEKGATFYGTFWCPHCAEQKKLFGSSVKYLPYVECSTPDGKGQLPVCTQANISSYPTWEFADGTRKTGTISLEELAYTTGCSI